MTDHYDVFHDLFKERPVSVEILETLRQQMGILQGSTGQAAVENVSESASESASEYVRTGCPAWDAWLRGSGPQCSGPQRCDVPMGEGGGFRRGQLVEWLAASSGDGAGTLALMIAGQSATEGRVVVVVDREGWFYPPAASVLGLDLSRLILLRPQTAADEVWALDQALRCPAVAAVWACLDRLDERDFRRLQLAAHQSGTLGMLLRPARVRTRPSWSDLQLLVTPHALSRARCTGRHEANGDTRFRGPQQQRPQQRSPQRLARRCWKITRLRGRQGVAGRSILLEMNDRTGQLQVVKDRAGELA